MLLQVVKQPQPVVVQSVVLTLAPAEFQTILNALQMFLSADAGLLWEQLQYQYQKGIK